MTKKSKEAILEEEIKDREFSDYLKVGFIHIKAITAEARANSKNNPEVKDYRIPDKKSVRFIELMKTEFQESLREQAYNQGWELTKTQISRFGNEMARYYCELTTEEYIDRGKMMEILFKIMNHYKFSINPGGRVISIKTRRGTK